MNLAKIPNIVTVCYMRAPSRLFLMSPSVTSVTNASTISTSSVDAARRGTRAPMMRDIGSAGDTSTVGDVTHVQRDAESARAAQSQSEATPALARESVTSVRDAANDAGMKKDHKYDVPKYKKIVAWDKENKDLKILGKILSSKRDRNASDSLVLEGVRMIKEAISHGHKPSVVVFSREKLLWQLELTGEAATKLYHIPYDKIKMWTDLTTSPGVMAAFSKQEVLKGAVARSPVSPGLTLICDNIRTPDNLGAVIRVAAAAGARQVICTRGCVDAWSPKVVRGGAGAHFLVPIIEGVEWGALQRDNLIDPFPFVLLSDLVHEAGAGSQDQETQRAELSELDAVCDAEGEEASYRNPELCDRYKSLPLATIQHGDLTQLPGFREAVVVVGGETEGVSGAAHLFCHRRQGAKLFVPLRNGVNSLNVVSAASLVMFKVRDALENTKPI